jgi:hypothetical protein
MANTTLPPQSETTPWVPGDGTTTTTGSTDLPPKTQTTPWTPTTTPGDSDSIAQAIGTGTIEGVPYARQTAAGATSGIAGWLRSLPQSWLNEDQRKALAGLPQSYSEANKRMMQAEQEAHEAHPYLQTATSLATGAAALPIGGATKALSGAIARTMPSAARIAPWLAATEVGSDLGAAYGASSGEGLFDPSGAEWGAGLGAIGGAGGYGLGKVIGPATGAVADAANRLGVPMPRYMMSNPAVQRIGTVSQSVPLIGEVTRRAAGRATDALADSVQKIGGGVTPDKAGAEISAALNNWIGPRSNAVIDRLYKNASSQLDPTIRSPLNATNQLVNSMAAKAAQRGSTLSGRAIDEINNANTVPGGLTYDAIKDLRTTIGQLKGSWGNINPDPIDAARITRLHGALTQDLDAAAARADRTGQGYAAHQRANRAYKAIQDYRDDLTPLVGAQGDKPAEQVFAGLIRRASENPSSADIGLLSQAKRAVQSSSTPQAWDTFERAVISRLGIGKSGFTPDLYLNHYSGIPDAAKDVLFSPQNRGVLNNAATVAQKMKEAGFAKNPSGSSHGTMAGLLGAGAIEYGGELLHHPFLTGAGLMGAYGAAKALTGPVTGPGVGGFGNYLAQQLARKGMPVAAGQFGSAYGSSR